MAKYRGAIIGLGWMGMLNDIGIRWENGAPKVVRGVWQPEQDRGVWHVDDVDRPFPEVNLEREYYYHHMAFGEAPVTYAEAMSNRPEIDLVAGAERDKQRLELFGHHYGVESLYTDAEEMLAAEKPDIVAISSNVKGRSHLTCLAVEHGAKGILVEKPICYTLEEADRMVKTCDDAGVPWVGGAITVNHPSFGKAKELINEGAIGEIISIEAPGNSNLSQHQNWAFFVKGTPAWVIGIGDQPKRESGTNEFQGTGIMVTADGLMVHFRMGAPAVRISGTRGEISHWDHGARWQLIQELETNARERRVEMPWPEPNMTPGFTVIQGLSDIINCVEGKVDRPQNHGRDVAMAFEVEIALKLSSAQGGVRIDLPLKDRSLELEYDWHR